MNKPLREIRRLIEQGGGRMIEVEPGRVHMRIFFVNPAGERQFVTAHRGTNPKRFEDGLRSQLRRAGLNP